MCITLVNENTLGKNKLDFPLGLSQIGSVHPSDEEVDEYHRKLEKYLNTEYRDYLIMVSNYKNFESRICPINLVLINNGTLPAVNTDVWIHFPDGFEIFEEIELPPYEPSPPSKPKIRGMLDSVMGSYHHSLVMPPAIRDINYPIEPLGPSISIRKTNSYEIEWGPTDLKHHHQHELPELYLLFNPIDNKLTGFEVEYEITADNLPDVITGKLIIRLEKL